MSLLGLPNRLGKPLAIAPIDLLLAGDNALVLALVCRTLPPRRLRVVLLLGTLGAVVLRVVLVAGSVLAGPGLQLVGGTLFTLLAINLAGRDARTLPNVPPLEGRSELLAATVLVMFIDLMISPDHGVALAAVAGGSSGYLVPSLTLTVAIPSHLASIRPSCGPSSRHRRSPLPSNGNTGPKAGRIGAFHRAVCGSRPASRMSLLGLALLFSGGMLSH